MDRDAIFSACKAELQASGQMVALRSIQSLEARLESNGQVLVPKKAVPFVACQTCRRAKARCVISQPGATQCDRCRSSNSECVIVPHKRGRKPATKKLDVSTTRPPDEDEEMSPIHSSISSPQSSHSHIISLSSAVPQNAEASSSTPARPPIPRNTSSDDSVDPPIINSAPHPLPFLSGSHPTFSIQSMLNPLSPSSSGERRSQETPEPSGDSHLGDPVSQGLVSLETAQQLFQFFMEKLNAIVLLFDEHLHTFEYVRQKSAFLFSAILSSAAKFVAPEVTGPIAQLTGALSLQAILASRRTIESIQGWMVIYFWKNARDNRAWTYAGLACRMGVELGLDCTPIETNPDATELEQREQRNRRRTWMLSFMIDRALASTTGRDWMIRGRDAVIRNHRQFSDHQFRLDGDAVIGGFTELRSISSEAVDRLYPGVENVSLRAPIDVARELLNVNYDLKGWLDFWTAETEKHRQPPIYMALLRLFGLHVQLTLNSFAIGQSVQMAPSIGSESLTPERYCYELAMKNLRQLRVIHELNNEMLRYMQDSLSIMVAYAACFLWKVIIAPQFTDVDRQEALQLIRQTGMMFYHVAVTRTDTAALQAQFLSSLAASSRFSPSHLHGQPDTRSSHSPQSAVAELSNGPQYYNEQQLRPRLLQGPNGMFGRFNDLPTGRTGVGNATWDQIMADWMRNPDYNSLQYQQFVNFANASYAEAEHQGGITENGAPAYGGYMT